MTLFLQVWVQQPRLNTRFRNGQQSWEDSNIILPTKLVFMVTINHSHIIIMLYFHKLMVIIYAMLTRAIMEENMNRGVRVKNIGKVFLCDF